MAISVRHWYVLMFKQAFTKMKKNLSSLSIKRAYEGKGALEYFLPSMFMRVKQFGAGKYISRKMVISYVFIRETEGMMKDGKIDIGDNDLLKMHFLNSALKINAESERCKLIKVEQRSHIDGMASFLCAMTVRQKYWNEIGRQLTNERRS